MAPPDPRALAPWAPRTCPRGSHKGESPNLPSPESLRESTTLADALISPVDLDLSHRLILKEEETYALRLAWCVLDKPNLSVWMILIPILLVQYFSRSKQYRAALLSFSEKVLQTKKQSLDLAREELRSSGAPEEAEMRWAAPGEPPMARQVLKAPETRWTADDPRAPCPPPEPEPSGKEPEAPGLPTLEEAHRAEVELLTGHYRRLLTQPGSTHAELIRGAYPTAGEYRDFLERLARAETTVHRAVLATHPGDEDSREVVLKMEGCSKRLRDVEAALLFGQAASSSAS